MTKQRWSLNIVGVAALMLLAPGVQAAESVEVQTLVHRTSAPSASTSRSAQVEVRNTAWRGGRGWGGGWGRGRGWGGGWGRGWGGGGWGRGRGWGVGIGFYGGGWPYYGAYGGYYRPYYGGYGYAPSYYYSYPAYGYAAYGYNPYACGCN